jgi:hypothetical protein
MSEIVFSRKPAFGAGKHEASGDLLVSRVVCSGGQKLSVRIHRKALDRLSWLVGDHVVVGINGEQVTLKRVRGPQEGGVKISAVNRASGHGAARFSADGKVLDGVFADGGAFRATLAAVEGGQAVFVKE